MRTVEVQLHAFLTSALDGGEWSASRFSRFSPGTHWIKKRKFLKDEHSALDLWAWADQHSGHMTLQYVRGTGFRSRSVNRLSWFGAFPEDWPPQFTRWTPRLESSRPWNPQISLRAVNYSSFSQVYKWFVFIGLISFLKREKVDL
jgi:hypothetical protein